MPQRAVAVRHMETIVADSARPAAHVITNKNNIYKTAIFTTTEVLINGYIIC